LNEPFRFSTLAGHTSYRVERGNDGEASVSTIDINGADDGADPIDAQLGLDPPDGIEIRTLQTADEMIEVGEIFRQVWGSLTPLVTIEILMAIAHSGGYVTAAYESRRGEERILGASVGMLARHFGRPALHSHITGLLPGARNSGLGRAMKLHQRHWAIDHDIEWIVWTFDPLVRRNAWFNIAVLGAEVHEYLPCFYGAMTDATNAGDESDRLLVAWAVSDTTHASPRDGSNTDDANTLVPTPSDIVALRRTDPATAADWRRRLRDALTAALDRGDRITGFTPDGNYVIERAS
jgi:predicted GNAT superfamily acetyltransferase